jgi:hypothetical protein
VDASDAKAVLFEAGVSEELNLAVAAVAEATTAQGTPRYSRRTIELLRRALICRNFARPVYELCHLVAALDACGGRDGYVRLLFEGTASASAFKGRVEQALARRGGFRRAGVERTAQGLALRYRDGIFQVSWSRMPFLAALMDFMAGALSYREVDAALRELLADPQVASAQRAANRISSALNRYLGQHLESEANGARFREILGFATSRGTGEAIFDDATVLAFWSEQCGGADNEPGFRAFEATFRAFVALCRVLMTGRIRQAAAAARDIDMPVDAAAEGPDLAGTGDAFDPERIRDRLAGLLDEWTSPLDDFAEPPVDRVKFFTRSERMELGLLLECGPQSVRFPLSILRCDIFGAAQSRLTQALRRRVDADELARLAEAVEGSYAERRDTYAALAEHVRQMQKASLHALRRSQPDKAAAPVIDLAAARAAEQAFKSFARQGFRDFDPAAAEQMEAFQQAAEPLVRIGTVLRDYLEALARRDAGAPNLAGWMETDRVVFRGRFLKMYGAVS